MGDEFLLGPRYVRLLEGIDHSGTIRAGCDRTKMSYRTCLTRLRRLEEVLGQPVVRSSRGGVARGGTELTPLGRALVQLYRSWREETERHSERAFVRARTRSGGRTGGTRHRPTSTPP